MNMLRNLSQKSCFWSVSILLFHLLTVNAFAFMEPMNFKIIYKGNGTLFTPEKKGKNIKYNLSTIFKRVNPTLVKVEETYHYQDGSTDVSQYLVEEKTPLLYQINDLEMKPIGYGYCFKLSSSFNGKKCHYMYTLDGVEHEQTFSVKYNRIIRMGSEMRDGQIIIKREGLEVTWIFPIP